MSAGINTFASEDLNKMLQKMTTIIKSHGNKASVPTLNQLLLTMSYPYLSTEFIKILFFRVFFNKYPKLLQILNFVINYFEKI